MVLQTKSGALFAVVCGCAAMVWGCSGDSGGNRNGDQPNGGPSSGSSASQSGSGAPDDFGNAENNPDASVSMMPIKPGDLNEECAGETQTAKRVQVDMYIMLDRSGSMLELTGATDVTKWDAVRSALTEFVSDPASAGLGVGLQYFPLGAPGIPDTCGSDSDCGTMGGPCTNRACLPPLIGGSDFPFMSCLTAADCPLNSAGCEPFGQCTLDPTLACFDLGAGGCADQGDCTPVSGGCLLFASCEVGDYASPAVPISLLPDNGMALVDSLAMEEPTGLTPTPVAIRGALEQCGAYARANPDHRVIVVLATDGLPTDCAPVGVMTVEDAVVDVAGVAAAGLAQTPSLSTYVIGVFSPDDPNAMQNLDMIAQAGGTERAFIIDSSSNVNEQFLTALDQIRGGTLACEFNVPKAPEGTTLDFNLVNVELTDGNDQRSLEYVETPDRCGESEIGWYYDVPPSEGTPTKINVCETTCTLLQSSNDASVEIRLGCPPITPI